MGLGRAVLLALAVSLVLSLSMGSLVAQEEPSGELPDESDGFVYFTDEAVSEWEYGDYDPTCYPPPRSFPIYGITPVVPRDDEIGKAYTPAYYGAAACGTSLIYEAQEAFTFGPGYQVTFWTGCDVPMPMVSPSRTGTFNDYAIRLLHNGEEIYDVRSDYPERVALDLLCRSESRLMGLETPLDLPDRLVREGDVVRLQIFLFGQPSPPDNVYLATGSTQAPSALHGPGLPGLLRDSPRSDLVVDLEQRTARTGPGNATTYPVTIENLGDEQRDVDIAVDGPGPWFAEPFPTTLTVPSNGTVATNLTVAAPDDTTNGTQAKHTVTITSAAEEVTAGLTTTVAPGTGIPAEEIPGIQLLDANEAPQWFEDEQQDSGSGLASFFQEFWIELTATAVVAIGAFVGRLFL